MRLVQIQHKDGTRRVARVDGAWLWPIGGFSSVYELAKASLDENQTLVNFISAAAGKEALDYERVYSEYDEWRLLPPIDHPIEQARCLVTGTGLTHMASAEARRRMHSHIRQGSAAPASHAVAIPDRAPENDSARMYRWGVEGGRPPAGAIGVSPEWFYKGNGAILRASGQPLVVPAFGEDGGEEPEIVGIYLIDAAGRPRRLGLSIGNEFSDHQFEKRNYLYLAGSKLRQCALGPELWIDALFDDIRGNVTIQRQGSTVWSAELATGQKHMCHSLANIEHHHFKFEEHRRPADVHVHFFGADAFSFGDGFALQEEDVMEIAFEGFGRPLRNHVKFQPKEQMLITALPI